ncbi:MAG: sulfite exporter TauE/SafE family protein [Desulfurivibrio sp.]|nr:sulfite exporter TauE/SafE family protein [Desulfurivibrio sp.]MBU4034699.1 sulfite exporter TauE/SafE family protein [Pseudomonadota bacterium]MBU4117429.1 sulfite exporter TauE/SafE family protein [Pseudomonadota bacterium]
MNFFRQLHHFMMAGARAHAKWEMDISNTILRDRRRLAILGLLLIPILIGGIAFADDVVSKLPGMIGGKTAYAPAFYTPTIFFASIGVGLVAGLITGCIGAGGGFIIAPALMSAGVKGILAVGTDLFHIFAKAIMGSVLHRKLGNVSVALAGVFLLGSIGGATLGGWVNRTLYDKNPVLSDAFITTIYVLMLGFLCSYALMDFFRQTRKKPAPAATDSTSSAANISGMTNLAHKLQNVNLPPMIKFDEGVTPGGRKISWLFLVISGFIVGLAAAIMGVGGGFLTFPIFVYVLGVSSATTVGTDIFQIIFTAGYAGLSQYAVYGFIFYTLAMGMLLGSLVGIQVGSLITKVVSGATICGLYAVATSAGFVNRAFALPSKLASMEMIPMSAETGKLLETVGTYIFFVVLTAFALWVFYIFFTNIKTLKGEGAAHTTKEAHS